MKQALFKIIPIALFLTLFSGCALLQLGGGDDVCQTDPVACAALSQRPPGDRTDLSADSSDRSPASDSLSPRQLTLGMSQNQVRGLWGSPQDVETAGDPQLGNERWTYYNGLSSRWSISQSRSVYFEEGRVVGWESGH